MRSDPEVTQGGGRGTVEVAIALGHAPSQSLRDPFLGEMLSALSEELARRGYDLLMSRVLEPLEEWLPQEISAPRADGIIILGESNAGAVLRAAALEYSPLVVWGGAMGKRGYCSVGTDNFAGAVLAVEHLLSLGRHAIVFLGDVEAMEMRLRYEGYRHALELAACSADHPVTSALLAQPAQGSIRELLSSGRSFDALFAASDVIALEAIKVLNEAGLRVPGDVAVVGFDDIALAALASPPLTTVRQDVAEGARVLVELLLRRMAGDVTDSVTLKPRLVVRESTRAHALPDAHGSPGRWEAARESIATRSLNDMRDALERHGILIITDPRGVITYANQHFCELAGYPQGELHGRTHRLIKSGVHGREFFAELWRTVLRGEVWRGEICNRSNGGDLFWVDTLIAPTLNRDGSVGQFICVGSDVTQRKRQESDLRLSDERFRLAFENAPIGIALIGITGRWLKVNDSMCRILGYTREELFATNFQSLTHPDDLANDLAQVEEVLAGKITSYQMTKRYFHRSGRVVPAMLSVSLVRDRDQRPQYFVSHVEDISSRLEAERAKNEFVAVVSHELRTPLTAIQGALGLLASKALGILPDKANAMVQIANQNCIRLARLINDILDVQKGDAGQLGIRPAPVELAPFLQQALRNNRAYAERCGVTLHLDPVSDKLAVLADPERLMQVLSNLLSNASKFSPLGRQVRVRCVPEDVRVVIQVIDQGVGIPETFRPRIFGRFAQADSSQARQFDGTGLGLNITRNLVHAMGGDINFVSEFGHGTTFFFDLPRAQTQSASAVSAA